MITFTRRLAIVLCIALSSVSGQLMAGINILTCEPEWAALAKEIGKEQVEVVSATTAFQDPHHIQARPSLIARARWADLVVCTGADLEVGWLPLLLRQSGNAQIQPGKPGHFMAAGQVELIEQLEEVDRSMGDIHAAGNPHLHLDPERLLKVARKLATRLAMLDKQNTQAYQENFNTFEARWQNAIQSWKARAQPLMGARAVVQHRNWSYLLAWLGIEAVADLEPTPGLPPTSGHLTDLLAQIENKRPDFILLAAYQSERGAQWLSRRSEIPVITLPYTVGGNRSARDLFSLYDTTLDMLLAGAR